MSDRLGAEAPPPRAVRHRVESDGTLWIEWDDGHQSSVDPSRLRAVCPCAQCREERAAAMAGRSVDGGTGGILADTEPGPLPPGSLRLVSFALVGRYGLTPTWGDGHRTGIYTWDALRGLCDCFACRHARREEP